MWTRLLHRLLDRMITEGTLMLGIGDTAVMSFGDGSGPRVTVHLRDDATVRRLLLDPELALGECYMEGGLQLVQDDVQSLMQLLELNRPRLHSASSFARAMARLRLWRRRFDQRNGRDPSRSNVSHHYDLTPEIYDLFLDAERQYSCAYFADETLSLDQAQRAKQAHIARKLLLRPGMRVLDIGCGWGGLALSLARHQDVEVLGITLSREQLQMARARAKAEGLADRVRFELIDYRDLRGSFDRIVSVGMFEHVGTPNFTTFFEVLRDRLEPDGVALVHSIGRTLPPAATNPWLAKYIFPGGYVPSLSEVARAIEGARLRVGDIECLRLHYAITLNRWFERFSARAEEARRLKGDAFIRMWRFYLAASEQAFRHQAQDVFQFQLCRDPKAIPLTRDYLYSAPQRAAPMPPKRAARMTVPADRLNPERSAPDHRHDKQQQADA